MKIIDLFAVCGGLSLGFANAGFEILAGFDNWQSAINVYENNFQHSIINIDLAKLEDFSLFENYKVDIIIGGPPCQDFSSAGKRNENDRANLTKKFAKIIAYLKPRYFVMENVARIINTQTLKESISIFKENNYGITSKIINSVFFGVPQIRKRFFMIGAYDENDNFFDNYLNQGLSENPLTVFDYLGDSLGIEHYYRHPRTYARRAIFSIYEPSPTIRGVNRPIPKNYKLHKGDSSKNLSDVRPLTSIERSYLQTFPKDFIWGDLSKSNFDQMVGNAVPVKLAEFIGKAMIEYLQNNDPNKLLVKPIGNDHCDYVY